MTVSTAKYKEIRTEREDIIVTKNAFKISSPVRNAGLTHLVHGTSNVLENTGNLPDFPNNRHDLCNKFFGNLQNCFGLFVVLNITLQTWQNPNFAS